MAPGRPLRLFVWKPAARASSLRLRADLDDNEALYGNRLETKETVEIQNVVQVVKLMH